MRHAGRRQPSHYSRLTWEKYRSLWNHPRSCVGRSIDRICSSKPACVLGAPVERHRAGGHAAHPATGVDRATQRAPRDVVGQAIGAVEDAEPQELLFARRAAVVRSEQPGEPVLRVANLAPSKNSSAPTRVAMPYPDAYWKSWLPRPPRRPTTTNRFTARHCTGLAVDVLRVRDARFRVRPAVRSVSRQRRS